MTTTLKANSLSRTFGPNTAVNKVSFDLAKGEVLGFLGPNGAGKSTTMRMLTGNLAPTHGSVEICGINIIEYPKLAKAKIGYLPEMRPLYKEFRVNEFLDANPHFRKGSLSGTGSQSSIEGKTVKPFNIQDLDMSNAEDRQKYAEYRKQRDSGAIQINLNNK